MTRVELRRGDVLQRRAGDAWLDAVVLVRDKDFAGAWDAVNSVTDYRVRRGDLVILSAADLEQPA